MRLATLLLLVSLGCGGPPALPSGGADCGSVHGANVYSFVGPCNTVEVQHYSDLYLRGWAAVSMDGWTVNLLPEGYETHANVTYWDERRMDLVSAVSMPHEMEHVRLGSSSEQHCGWISDGFALWSRVATQGGTDDLTYVMHTCPENP